MREDRGAGLLRGEVAVAPGDREARREALDVPLPGPRKGLVEVVDVQHQTAIGGGEDAEVREVGIAACLDAQPGLGGLREVHRHDRRGAAKERERRGQHPPVADRHELRDAALGLVLEHLDRISPARCRLPFPVARARNLLPRRLAGGCALLWGGGVHERRFGGRGGHGLLGQCGTGDHPERFPARLVSSGRRRGRCCQAERIQLGSKFRDEVATRVRRLDRADAVFVVARHRFDACPHARFDRVLRSDYTPRQAADVGELVGGEDCHRSSSAPPYLFSERFLAPAERLDRGVFGERHDQGADLVVHLEPAGRPRSIGRARPRHAGGRPRPGARRIRRHGAARRPPPHAR